MHDKKKGKVLFEHKIYNSRQGFDFFKRVVDETVKRERLWDVLVGFEPTVVYWRKIAYFAKDLGYEVRFVRTTALKHQRELDESAPYTEPIHSIPGAGMTSTGIILGEFGYLDNFCSAKQGIKYAGYDPTGKESGKHVGKRRISKKGRLRLRKTLYLMGMRVVRFISEFKEYYERKLEGTGGRKLARKEALCAVIKKLIKLIFALCRDRRKFETRNEPTSLAA
ncbi:transposase [bacterium]|nr:transposase [bacterium]